MSFINNNSLQGASPFGLEQEAGFGPQSGLELAAAQFPPAGSNQGDAIWPSPWSAFAGEAGAGASGGGTGGLLGTVMGLLSGLMNQLGSLVGSGSGTSSGACASSGCGAGGQSGSGQFFQNASASSTGDPHDAFNGTSAGGATSGSKWDDMHGHGDLLSSDSFAGGYRVSTTATPPNDKGVTYNGSATVTAGGGATSVSMNGDGSYSVTSYGRTVPLQQGQAVSLGGGESVTLNADGSLTVADANANGGSIQTTLKADGAGGVDVTNQASDVDLGGYLVNRGQGQGPGQGGYGAPGLPYLPVSGAPVPYSGPWSGTSGGSSSGAFAAALDGSDLTQLEDVGLLS
jgi:hypothetical protein